MPDSLKKTWLNMHIEASQIRYESIKRFYEEETAARGIGFRTLLNNDELFYEIDKEVGNRTAYEASMMMPSILNRREIQSIIKRDRKGKQWMHKCMKLLDVKWIEKNELKKK